MQINLINQNPTLQFCGSNPSQKAASKTKASNFSLLRAQTERYKNGYCKPIIPDLLDYIAITGRLKQEDIKGIAGHGGLSIVFDLGDSVLKASLENPLEFREHNPEIDIPFLSPVEKQGKTYFVREAKADTKNVTTKDCFNVIKRMKKMGLEPSRDLDMYRTHQIGKYQDKAYLLDTRCARPRPNRFSRFIYDFQAFNNRVFFARSMDTEAIAKQDRLNAKRIELFGPQIMHIDEFPRPNLSLKRGLAIMRGVMNRNKNYDAPVLSLTGALICIIRAIFK